MPTESVTVAVRCRPFNQRELEQREANIVTIGGDGYVELEQPDDASKRFNFDFSYDENSTQDTVYRDLGQPLLQQAFEGWNGTIFAYGQTGSGKTFSMAGTKALPGMVPKMCKELYTKIEEKMEANPNIKFLVTCSFLEIYNEVLYDLLDPNASRQGTGKRRGETQLDVKEHPTLGVYVSGLQEIPADTSQKILTLIDQGNDVRAVASTAMNATSSRSHSIFIIRMMSTEVVDGQKREMRSTVNLVDLAGSERAAKTGATGEKLKEGANINKSLSALGAVINALAENSKGKRKVFIPYRNSKLTRVLQESLGGNSVTIMMAAISPAAYNLDETLSTLQYADRAKAIQLKARKNEQLTEVGKLKREIDELKALLAAAGGGGSPASIRAPGDPATETRMLKEMEQLQALQQQSFEEKERIALEMEQARAEAMKKQAELRRAQREKYETERAIALQAGTSDWVPMLLRSTRSARSQADIDFCAAAEAMHSAYRSGIESLQEHNAFTTVLQSALAKESSIFLHNEAARSSGESAATDFADDMGSKVLMEQILLKMKNLREELAKTPVLTETMLSPLDELATAAESHAEIPRAVLDASERMGGDELALDERERLEMQASDLELLSIHAQKEKVRLAEKRGSTRALEPLKEMAVVVQRGVESELAQVEVRLKDATADGSEVEEAQRAGIEKRTAVLKKELHVLRDILARDELSKVLHGLSQVVQGVVVRTGKRMTMRDRAKDKTLAVREQQAEKLKVQMEEMREALFGENESLREEKTRALRETDLLRTALTHRESTLSTLIGQVQSFAVAAKRDPEAAAAAASSAAAAAAAAISSTSAAAPSVDSAANSASPAGADANSMPPAPESNTSPPTVPLTLGLNVLVSKPAASADAALLGDKLQIVSTQLAAAEESLAEMTERARRATQAVEEELAPLKQHNEVLKKQLRAVVNSPQLQSIANGHLDDERLSAPAGCRPPARREIVRVPEGVGSGQKATVTAPSGREVSLMVPVGAEAGDEVEVEIPVSPGAASEEVSFVVPPGVGEGDQVAVTAASGREVMVTVPDGVVAGDSLQVEVPCCAGERVRFVVPQGSQPGSQITITTPSGLEVEVVVPEGAAEGEEVEVDIDAGVSAVSSVAALLAKSKEALAGATAGAGRHAGFDAAREGLTLELSAAKQEASKKAAELAEMALQVQSYEAQAQAATAPSAASLSEMQAALRTAQEDAARSAGELAHAREEELPELERRVMALRQENFKLKEAALNVEEEAVERQDELHNLRQEALKTEEKLYAAEVQVATLEAQAKERSETSAAEAKRLTGELAALRKNENARLREMEEFEAEKYTMAQDIENLQEELEDANTQQKKYYEALMTKEEKVRQLKHTCKKLERVVERLQYEADLKVVRANVPHEAIGPGFAEMEALEATNRAKDAELRKLKAELERVGSEIVEEEDYEIGGRTHDDANTDSSRPPTREQRSSLLLSLQKDGAAPARAATADLRAAKAQLSHATAAKSDLQERLVRAEAVAEHAKQAAASAEELRRKQESEALQLIRARDELDDLQSAKDEEISEMNDQLYEKTQLLEAAEETVAALQAEAHTLREEVEGQRSATAQVQRLKQELAEEREEKERLSRLLQQAIG
uniref:Kinesin motor domain-containing protein n=1 Tax=Emiliania huxleyi TaxID=2903 RepID=A0A7S3ST25_EMIHU